MDRNRQAIAQEVLGQIDWITSDRGFIKCPGEQFHNGKTGKKDCRVIISDAPTIFCFHASCSGEVEASNKLLRKAIGGHEFVKKEFTIEEKEEFKKKQEKKAMEFDLQLFAGIKKEVVFDQFAWPPADMFEESPTWLNTHPDADSLLFLKLWNDDDVLWNGAVMDSGCPRNRFNFKKVSDWRNSGIKGNFTSGSAFKENCFSRSNENVIQRKFLVVESDTLAQDQICAVFNFCRKFLKLRAVVFTGNRSLHGWMDFPSEKTFNVLQLILPQWGCDPALFKPSQPVRMPGIMRGEKWQALLYLDLTK